jgi:hypothetical protein
MGQRTVTRSLPTVVQIMDGKNGENPHFPCCFFFRVIAPLYLEELDFLRLVTRSFRSKIVIRCSGYDKSALSGATSGNTMPTGAFKHFFNCDMWKMS